MKLTELRYLTLTLFTLWVSPVYSNDNMIRNGNFQNGMSPWQVQTHRQAAATNTIENDQYQSSKALKIITTQADEKDWSIQLIHPNLMLSENFEYLLSFVAKANSKGWISVSLQQDAGGNYKTIATSKGAVVGTDWQRHEVLINSPKASTATGRLILANLNKQGLEIQFTQFELTQQTRQDPHLNNPQFSRSQEVNGAQVPMGWKPAADSKLTISLDREYFLSEPASMLVRTPTNGGRGILRSNWKGKPSSSFVFKGNCHPRGTFDICKVSIQQLDKDWKGIGMTPVGRLSASDSWQPFEGVVDLKPKTAYLKTIIEMDGKGYAWFDDFKVEPVIDSSEDRESEATLDGYAAQEIKGWGSMAVAKEWWDKDPWVVYEQKNLIDAFYKLGQTHVRANYHWDISWDEETGAPSKAMYALVKRIKEAQARGIKNYILTIWSPPRHMKTNGITQGYADFNKNRALDENEVVGHLKEDKELEFIAWYLKGIKHLEKEVGLPVAITIQNEPDMAVAYEGCVYPVDQWIRQTIRMRKALDDAGYQQVLIHGPDGNYGKNIYWDGKPTKGPGYLGPDGFSQFKKHPDLEKALGAYAFHSYSQGFLDEIVKGIEAYPKDVWMTENSTFAGKGDLDFALFQTRTFISDMVDVPNNYWFHWVTVKKADEFSRWALISGQDKLRFSKRYWVFKKLWNLVRPGWRVVKMSTDDPFMQANKGSQDKWVNVDMVSFVNPERSKHATLLVNHRGTCSLTIKNLIGNSAKLFQLTHKLNMEEKESKPLKDGSVTFHLPHRSISIVETF